MENLALDVPGGRPGPVVDPVRQRVEGLVQAPGLAGLEAIKLAIAALETGWRLAVYLATGGRIFVDQYRPDAGGDQDLRRANAGGAGADDDDPVVGVVGVAGHRLSGGRVSSASPSST